MSYEGYTQLICKKGHYWTVDCNMDYDLPCYCGAPIVWSNMVNETNGCEAVYGDPHDLTNIHTTLDDCICGQVNVELIEEKACNKCGSVLSQRYKIPKKGGYRVK